MTIDNECVADATDQICAATQRLLLEASLHTAAKGLAALRKEKTFGRFCNIQSSRRDTSIVNCPLSIVNSSYEISARSRYLYPFSAM